MAMTIIEGMALVCSFSVWLPADGGGIDMPNPTDWQKGEHICLENHNPDPIEVNIGITKNNGVSIKLPSGVTPCKTPVS